MATLPEFRGLHPGHPITDDTVNTLMPAAVLQVGLLINGNPVTKPQQQVAAECAMVLHLYWDNKAQSLSDQVGRKVTLEKRGSVEVTATAVSEARKEAEKFLTQAKAYAAAARGGLLGVGFFGAAR